MSTQIRLSKVFLLTLSTTAALTTQLLIASPAKAQVTCVYEGTTYQVGARVGPLKCMPDGTWQPGS